MQKNSKYVIEKHRNLVEACALDDRNAQIKIYNLYYKAMYNTSLRIVNDSFFAEDIMQEAFLDAFSKIKTFEWRSSFGSWLKRIVINKSLDSIKKENNLIPLGEDADELAAENENQNFEDIQCKVEEIKIAFKSLRENYRIILSLHLFEGYDHQEISQILDLPYNNVRVRYLRAKRKLLEIIIRSRN